MKSPGKTPVVETIKIDRSEEGEDRKAAVKADQYNQ